MKRLFAGSLLLCAACVAGLAAAAEAPRKVVSLEGVTEYPLANGLRLLTLPDPGIDTATVHITYLVGSRHEGYGEKGMARGALEQQVLEQVRHALLAVALVARADQDDN